MFRRFRRRIATGKATVFSESDNTKMASYFPFICLHLLLLLHAFTLSLTLSIASATAVHDILPKYGLPVGVRQVLYPLPGRPVRR